MNSNTEKQFEPIVTDFAHIQEVLAAHHIVTDGDINKADIRFCKVEPQQDATFSALSIPKLDDLKGERLTVAMIITKDQIVVADDEGTVTQVIDSMKRLNWNPNESKEKYQYYLLTGLISKAFEMLEKIEDALMVLEQDVLSDREKDFNQKISMHRQGLLILRSYYEEISDMGKAFEEDENEDFDEELLKYFGIVSDRAERLVNKAGHLLDLCKEVKDTYDSKISAQQNANMEFLTVITSVFFPLTLITGWYGMNFDNMPELSGGYPFVITLSVIVILIVIVIFKKKKML